MATRRPKPASATTTRSATARGPIAIPDKPYFKIGEVAAVLRVKPSVLRFWETEFPSVRPEKSRTGQRVYDKKTALRLLAIRALLYEQGYTVAGARKKLREDGPQVVAEVLAAAPPPTDPARRRQALAIVRELLQLCDD